MTSTSLFLNRSTTTRVAVMLLALPLVGGLPTGCEPDGDVGGTNVDAGGGGGGGTNVDAGTGGGGGGGGGTTADAGTGGGGGGSDAGVEPVEPPSVDALAVGYWWAVETSCDTGSIHREYAYTMCPGGGIRGGGTLRLPDGRYDLTEVVCGTYTTRDRVYDDCSDRYGCFDRIEATVRSTIGAGGETNTATEEVTLLVYDEHTLFMQTVCNDESTGWLYFGRVAGSPEDHSCESSYCSSSGSGGSTGCSTDCDCGRCWYCDGSGGSGTCRYGGEGPYGCYRGCSF